MLVIPNEVSFIHTQNVKCGFVSAKNEEGDNLIYEHHLVFKVFDGIKFEQYECPIFRFTISKKAEMEWDKNNMPLRDIFADAINNFGTIRRFLLTQLEDGVLVIGSFLFYYGDWKFYTDPKGLEYIKFPTDNEFHKKVSKAVSNTCPIT